MMASATLLDGPPAAGGTLLDGTSQMQERIGLIRLPALPARDLRHACTFTEFIGGPRSSVTVRLATDGLEPGDVAGLALTHARAAWVAVERGRSELTLRQFDEQTATSSRVPLGTPDVWLRAECDLVGHHARFSYSADGRRYTVIGEPCVLGSNRTGFPSVGCVLFSYTTRPGARGGHADFDAFLVTWP
jgi:beta-xylosidase